MREPDPARAEQMRSIAADLRDGDPATAHDPDAALNTLAAAAAIEARRYDDAERHARRSLGTRPQHEPTLVLLGRALRSSGRSAEAATVFEAAVRLSPGSPMPVFLLCATWLENGDPRAAVMLDGLLARFPDAAIGWEEIGTVLARLGKRTAALACWNRALRSAPTSALALRIGAMLREAGRLAEAADAFRQASDLDPRGTRARFLQGLCLQDLGRHAAAASAYREVLALDPTLAEAAVNLGTVLQDSGDLDSAKVAYGQALAARPDTFGRIAQAMTTSRRGELWLDLGRLRRTLAR